MDYLRRRLSQGGEGDPDSPSFSSSVTEGTSRFFSSLSAKKNGLLSDLSNKFESVGATLMKNSPSGSSENSELDGQEKRSSYAKQRQDSNTTNSVPVASNSPTTNGRVVKKLQRRHSSDCSENEENYPGVGANISFDEPIYSPSTGISSKDQPVGVGPSWKRQSPPPPIPPPPSKIGGRRSRTESPRMSSSGHSSDSEQRYSKTVENKEADSEVIVTEREKAPKFATSKRRSSTVDEMLFDDYVEPEPEIEPVVIPNPAEEEDTDNVFTKKKKTLLPMGDLISFDEPDLDDFHPHEKVNRRHLKKDKENKSGEKEYASVSSVGSSELEFQTSVDSSDVDFGGDNIPRLGSIGSEKSWSSTYSLDSQPDDLTLECMGFMKAFVEKIFNPK